MPDVGEEVPPFGGTNIISDSPFNTDDDTEKIILVSFIDFMDDQCAGVIRCLVELWNNYEVWNTIEGHKVQIVVVHPDTDPDPQHKTDIIDWLVNELRVTFPALYGGACWLDYIEDIDISQRNKPVSFIVDRNMIIKNRYYRGIHPECGDLKCSLLDVKIERDPIDLEMVMDVSGSMNNPSPDNPGGMTKFEMMKQATCIIGDYLEDNSLCNERMGLIWFTDDVREYENSTNQKLLTIPDNWPELRDQIIIQETGTCTAMGSGLQTAFNTLSISNQKGYVILCTDGIQNINPLVIKVDDHYEIINGDDWCGTPTQIGEYIGINIAEYTIPVHTIGVGITANYEPLLDEIATQTQAFYRGTNDPDRDLDFIYLACLCNCMAGGSPSILYHNTGSLSVDEHKKVESFYLNNSVRKITAILSWKKSQESNFTFWLYSPDGTLLNLHSEMKLFENHCMATIYLPKRQNRELLKYAGEWRMMIRGELLTTPADYHMFIIGEDTDVKLLVDFPKKPYVVGDLLPIKVTVLNRKKPLVLKPKDITIEMKSLPEPLPELLAEYKVTVNELLQKMKKSIKKVPKNPLILKLNAMTSDPQFQKRLIPFTKQISIQEGNLKYEIENGGIMIPIALELPGLHSFNITVRYEDSETGPICRTDMISIIVIPGKADRDETKINFIEPSTDKLKGRIINITPRNKKGQLLGPGYSNEFKLQLGKKEFDVEFKDLLDGTYQIEPPISEKEMVGIKEKDLDVDITFHNNLIWRGKL